ncbi:hypothetical protein LAZ67_5002672 [Cordylochernes scorpioides]|uniref:Uncharacterized protein n=1 Tax=Cordylochernes scorpioides TaxID=51811 RepID=A0ABY6KHA4_9ARAC|nr:hypothetical protein LAZ67_5002672 [Cordylochernes scorpioides]
MEQKLKQRICIEFCVKIQISATETFEMFNNTSQREQLFLNGILDLKLAEFPLKMILIEQDTGISKTAIGRIVTEDLKLKKTPAKFIPRFLTNEQKLCRLATCEDMLEMTRSDQEWKDKIITWVNLPSGEVRVLLIAFLDNESIVHHEYLPAGQTVIKEMYLGILRRLREAIRKKGQKYGLMVTGSYTMTIPALTERTWDDIIEKSLLALKSISKEAYKNCFDNWEKRWRCYIASKTPLWVIVRIPLDPVWISWNEVCPRLTRTISPKPWSLGGRLSVCQNEQIFITKEQEGLKENLNKYDDFISPRLGTTNLAKHRIDTEDATLIKHNPYWVSAKERDIMKNKIDEMLKEGIIRPSSSPWSFHVILVKKRDGKFRFCVDYRKLNEATVKDVCPIPINYVM